MTDFANGGSQPNQLPNSSYWNLDNWGSCGGDTLSESNTNDPGTANTNLDGFNPAQSAYLSSNGLAISAVRNPNVPLGSANSYISAQVDSLGPSKESDQYGEVEASIDMPTAQGVCPGFWMLGDNNIAGSNIPGEIDVVEAPTFGDGPGSSSDFFDLHGTSVNGTTQQYQSEIPQVSPGFHTYAIIWTPTSITWQIDGTSYAYASQSALVAGASWANDYSYGRFHLIFDLAVGGWSCDYGECGPSSAEAAPSYTMYIQWVKWLKLPS
jgi:beta-glucanase (GH16 family)